MKLRRTLLLTALLMVGVTANAGAQELQPSAAKVEASRKFDLMVGKWLGSGWWQVGPQRVEFRSEETATRRAGGLALELLGRHVRQDGGKEVVVHDAFAMVWWDEPTKAYRMKSALQNGQVSEFELNFTANGYTWSHPGAGGRGRIRYTASFTADTWKESGEFSLDGQNWKPVFEMSLKRVE